MKMLSWLAAPSFTEPEKARAARLLNGLLWLTLAAFILLSVGTFFLQPGNLPQALPATVLVSLLTLISLGFLRRGHLAIASVVFVFQIWLVVTVSAVRGGGMETPAVQGYLLVVLAAGLLVGWRLGVLTGLICIATQVALSLAEINGQLPPYQGLRTPITYLIVYTLISGVAAIFVYYYVLGIRTALELARRELADRQRAEQALRESEARMRVFAEATFEGIAISVDEQIVEANEQFARMLGYSLPEVIGTTVTQTAAPESLTHIQTAIREHSTEPYEAELVRQDGSRFPVELRGRPIEHHGRPARLSAVRDLTDRKRAEARLVESERRFRDVVESAPDAVVIVDGHGRVTLVNQQTEQLFGYERDEILGQPVEMLMPQRFQQPHTLHRNDFQAAPQMRVMGRNMDLWGRRKNGSEFPVDINLSPLQAEGEAWVLSSIRDMTERRQAEAALRESEARFHNAFEYAAIGMGLVAPDGRWLRVNRSLCELAGYAPDELLARTSDDITYPEDVGADRDAVRQLLAREIQSFQLEKRYRHKSGLIVWTLLSVSLVQDPQGRPLYFVYQAEDSSQRKQAEAAQARTQYQLRERIKELTTLHGVAQLLQAETGSLSELLQGIVQQLPPGWQYPEITAARITYDGATPATPDFRLTPWMQRAEFQTPGGQTGSLEVAYLEERPAEAIGPFFVEEQNLIQTVAEMLQTYLARRQAESHSQRQLEHITVLHEIDSAILTSTDQQFTFKLVIDHILEHLGADAAAFYLLNPHLATLEFAAGAGFRTAGFDQEQQRLDQGYASEAVLRRRPVRIPTIAAAPDPSPRTPRLLAEGFVSYLAVPMIAKGEVNGVLEIFHRAATQPDAEWLDFAAALASQAAIAVDNLGLFQELKRRNLELVQAYDVTLEGWSKALDLRDKETEGHTQRVTNLTLRLARSQALSDRELTRIRQGGLLHDVGKLGIPDNILLKPGPLSEAEWAIMRRHPVYAYEWLSPIAYLRPALDIPYCHHEKWDGTGYPRGLAGETIPLAARLFAVVDVYDALTSERPYRHALTPDAALEYIREQSGRHFDPRVATAFVALLKVDNTD